VFTTVATFREPWEAHLLRGRLEAEGIPAIVIHEHYISVDWTLSFALGRVKVQVPESQLDYARDIDGLCRDGVYRDFMNKEFGDIDAPRCPYCACSSYERRRPYPRAALAITASVLTGYILPPKGWIYGCKACGARYQHELIHVPWTRWPLCFLLAIALMTIFGLGLWAIFTTKFGLLAIGAALIASASWTARVFQGAPEASDPSEQN
jgi:hypothetical protein